MHKTILFALVILSGLSAGALAANQVIHQQGRVFSSESVTIKKGDALTFVNDDSIPHNIMSATKGSEFNLGSQAPGMSTDVTFKSGFPTDLTGSGKTRPASSGENSPRLIGSAIVTSRKLLMTDGER